MFLPYPLLENNRGELLQFDAAGAPLLRATRDVAAGGEVFIDYGGEKSDAELAAYYGYRHDDGGCGGDGDGGEDAS